MGLWETLGEDFQGLVRHLGGFGRGFVRIWETLEDFGILWERIWETWDTLGEDLPRLWDRICEILGDTGRGFTMI